MKKEAERYYEQLRAICVEENIPLRTSYLLLRELLEEICRMQMPDNTLQMTDLSARVSFVASKLELSIVEQNRLHSFRLTSNELLNGKAEPSRERLMCDAKTLAFLVMKVTDEEIPSDLYHLFPQSETIYRAKHSYKERIQRMRVCFQYSDEQYLYVQPSEILSDKLLMVRYNVPQVNNEFAETCTLLWQHAQLNLLDVSIDADGILTPGLIVLEPDYLIDVSALAECFKEYGHHPLNYVFARLQPPENTLPLLLGNIVNLFLDEWIYASKEPDYVECMKKAFRRYPIELAACEELRDKQKEREFFECCKLHFWHIRQTLTETFKTSGYNLDKHDAVLEPAYICEALGLQGRLDYMQRNMRSFIEMKSGKADEYSIRGKIVPRENNKVQMLLYQAILEYSMGISHHQSNAYLFYTRYPLLYPARPSWAMVRRILNLRNRIVAAEYDIQLHNSIHYTAEQLSFITPDVLNERGLDSVLWKRYLYPQIEKISSSLNKISQLEKKYFYTLYNFITKELYTSKSGDTDNGTHVGASSLWLSTLVEKCETGDILYNLRIIENKATEQHKPSLLLAQTTSSNDDKTFLPNFRPGDAVLLYERNLSTDNVTNKMIFKGSIEWITEEACKLRLRAPQQNALVLPNDSYYAIEHDYMDTSYRSMYQGLACFLQANEQRKKLLLGQRKPMFDTTYDDSIANCENDFQRVTLKAQASQDYFLLLGPPGTGKTSHALRSMVETFHKEGKQLLLMAYTNRAVDEICKSLSAIVPAINYIRIGSELACEHSYHSRLMENILSDCHNRKDVQARINGCQIFVTTIATLSMKPELFSLKTFDVAIIDEASQIIEPQLLPILCARNASGGDAIRKFIMIGDYKQLPAVVLQGNEHSEVHDEELREMGLLNVRNSLFERLYRQSSQLSDLEFRVCDMLCKQGRMNLEVAAFPNEAFYEGRLQIVGLPHQQGSLPTSLVDCDNPFAELMRKRVAFIPAQAEPNFQTLKINHSEARLVACLAAALYARLILLEGFDVKRTLGIIAPYRSQIALIKTELANMSIPLLNEVTVDTVERYQGSERDVIIYSFCVNHTHQLKTLSNLTEENGILIDRKLNVVLTRARKQLFLVGVPHVLEQNPIYARLLEHIKNIK